MEDLDDVVMKQARTEAINLIERRFSENLDEVSQVAVTKIKQHPSHPRPEPF